MKITVAICTYNRADSLADTLEYLCGQSLGSQVELELLLIDNNCSDHTSTVVDSYKSRLLLRYFIETRQGLSHGRNRAIKECRSDLLVFADDDIRPDPFWLSAYMEASTAYPDAGYFGGPIAPYWPDGKPGWVRDINMPLLGGLFGTYECGGHVHLYEANEVHPFGANFMLRRSLFEELDPFRIDLGMNGNVPGRGEEAEYFKRAKEAGSAGVYVPAARVQHRVDASHLTLSYLYRFGVQKGIASRKIHQGWYSGKYGGTLEFLFKGLYQLMKGRGDRFRQCVINMGIERGMRDSNQ